MVVFMIEYGPVLEVARKTLYSTAPSMSSQVSLILPLEATLLAVTTGLGKPQVRLTMLLGADFNPYGVSATT